MCIGARQGSCSAGTNANGSQTRTTFLQSLLTSNSFTCVPPPGITLAIPSSTSRQPPPLPVCHQLMTTSHHLYVLIPPKPTARLHALRQHNTTLPATLRAGHSRGRRCETPHVRCSPRHPAFRRPGLVPRRVYRRQVRVRHTPVTHPTPSLYAISCTLPVTTLTLHLGPPHSPSTTATSLPCSRPDESTLGRVLEICAHRTRGSDEHQCSCMTLPQAHE